MAVALFPSVKLVAPTAVELLPGNTVALLPTATLLSPRMIVAPAPRPVLSVTTIGTTPVVQPAAVIEVFRPAVPDTQFTAKADSVWRDMLATMAIAPTLADPRRP